MIVRIRLKYLKHVNDGGPLAHRKEEVAVDAWANASDLVFIRPPPEKLGANFKVMLPVCLAPEPLASWEIAMGAWFREPGVVEADRLRPGTPAMMNAVAEAQIVLKVNEVAALKKQLATLRAEMGKAQIFIEHALGGL